MPEPRPTGLLDPKNDYVFKRLFADSPDLLAALISAVRWRHSSPRLASTCSTSTSSPIRPRPSRPSGVSSYDKLKGLSADARTRRLAFVRERALRDERSLLRDAREEGRKEALTETALNLIHTTALDDATIATVTGLSAARVAVLRHETDTQGTVIRSDDGQDAATDDPPGQAH